jgi:hypothetical protein
MTLQSSHQDRDVLVSLGVIAWNEEGAIGAMLDSLFEQSLFAELARRSHSCEIVCLANGCTDRTTSVVARIFERQQERHPQRENLLTRVIDIEERGKLNAWNQFVHSISAREARFLFLADADIVLPHRETLWNMLKTLEAEAQASVAVDSPRKEISLEKRPSIRTRLSLGASQITAASPAQLCGQLYCIRSEIARNIYLPKDLRACEDGFIKQLVCTNFLTHEVLPDRIRRAHEAEHTFEAYTSVLSIFRNQKRQIIGQTVVHILVDDYLKRLPLSDRLQMATTLREFDRTDPSWLKRLIAEHLQKTRVFWRLYPALLTQRLKCLGQLPWLKRLTCLPSAIANWVVTVIAAWLAYRTLKSGSTDYWPRVERFGLSRGQTVETAPLLAPFK